MQGHETTHFLNPRAKRVTKPLGDLGRLQHFELHLITLPVGSVASEFHRQVYAKESVDILAGNGTVRMGPDMFEIEVGDFIAYPPDDGAHDIRNTVPSPMTCIVVEQRLDFDVVYYPRKINVSIAMPETPGILSILPLSAAQFCQMRVGKDCKSQFLWGKFFGRNI